MFNDPLSINAKQPLAASGTSLPDDILTPDIVSYGLLESETADTVFPVGDELKISSRELSNVIMACNFHELHSVDKLHHAEDLILADNTKRKKTLVDIIIQNYPNILFRSTLFRNEYIGQSNTKDMMMGIVEAGGGMRLDKVFMYRGIGLTNVKCGEEHRHIFTPVCDHQEHNGLMSHSDNYFTGWNIEAAKKDINANQRISDDRKKELSSIVEEEAAAYWVWYKDYPSKVVLTAITGVLYKLPEYLMRGGVWVTCTESLEFSNKRFATFPADAVCIAAFSKAILRGPDKAKFLRNVGRLIEPAYPDWATPDFIKTTIESWNVVLGSAECVVQSTEHKIHHTLFTDVLCQHSVHFLPKRYRYWTLQQHIDLDSDIKNLYAKHFSRVLIAANLMYPGDIQAAQWYMYQRACHRMHGCGSFASFRSAQPHRLCGCIGTCAEIVGGLISASKLNCAINKAFGIRFHMCDVSAPVLYVASEAYGLKGKNLTTTAKYVEASLNSSSSTSGRVSAASSDTKIKKRKKSGDEVTGEGFVYKIMIRIVKGSSTVSMSHSSYYDVYKLFRSIASSYTFLRIIGYCSSMINNSVVGKDHFEISLHSPSLQLDTTMYVTEDQLIFLQNRGIVAFEIDYFRV